MKGILFSPEIAEDLNEKVKKRISTHLFISCNYEPVDYGVRNDDAKFIVGVLNLYKFTIDSSCVISAIQEIAPEFTGKDYNLLMHDIYGIRVLSDYFSQNTSKLDGFSETTRKEKYHEWMKEKIGKVSPETNEDYKQAYHALEAISTRIINILNHFIDTVVRSIHKLEIISNWENKIIKWYCCEKQSIFLGQMANEYFARALANGNQYLIIQKQIDIKVAFWIRKFYFGSTENDITQLENLWRDYGKKFPSDKRKILKTDIENKLKILVETKNEISQKICKALGMEESEVDAIHCQRYFFLNLESLMLKTVEQTNCNLLPQELMQILIRNYFSDVHSEDF